LDKGLLGVEVWGDIRGRDICGIGEFRREEDLGCEKVGRVIMVF
jgi:hypothetical protein